MVGEAVGDDRDDDGAILRVVDGSNQILWGVCHQERSVFQSP